MADNKIEVLITAKDKASVVLSGVTKSIQGVSNAAFSLKGAMAGLATSMVAKSFIDTYNQFTQFRKGLDTLEGSITKGTKKWKELLKFAKDTPFTVTEVMNAYTTLRAYGIDPTIETMTRLGDTAMVLGKDRLPLISLALGQIKSANKLFMQDLRQLMSAGINVNKVLMDNFNLTQNDLDQLNQAIASGTITTQQVLDAFYGYMRDKFGGQMSRMMNTLKGQFEILRSNVQILQDSFMNAGPANAFTRLLKRLNDQIESISKKDIEAWGNKVGKALSDAFDYLLNHKKEIIKTLKGVADHIKRAADAGRDIAESLVPALDELAISIEKINSVLPSGIESAAWKGIIFRFLFGSAPIGIVVGGISIITGMISDLYKVMTKKAPASILEKWFPKSIIERVNELAGVQADLNKAKNDWVKIKGVWVNKADVDNLNNAATAEERLTAAIAKDNAELDKYYKKKGIGLPKRPAEDKWKELLSAYMPPQDQLTIEFQKRLAQIQKHHEQVLATIKIYKDKESLLAEAEAAKENAIEQAKLEYKKGLMDKAWQNIQEWYTKQHPLMEQLRQSWGLTWEEIRNKSVNVWQDIGAAVSNMSRQMADAFVSIADGTESAKDAAKEFLKSLLRETLQTLIKIATQQLILKAIGQTALAATTATTIASMAGITAAAAPAAMLMSIATMGSAPAVGATSFATNMGIMAGVTAAMKVAGGAIGMAPGFAEGGIVYPNGDSRGVGIRVAEKGPEAIIPLSKGRSVPVEMKGTGQQVINHFHINAADAKSFTDMIRRNPEAITSIVLEDLNSYGPIRNGIRNTL